MRAPRADVPWSRGRVKRRAMYSTYMKSFSWRQCRERWHAEYVTRFAREPRCVVCDEVWTPRVGDLHHASYARLGNESFENLVPLCRADHQALHDLFDQSVEWRRLGRKAATAGIVQRLHVMTAAKAVGSER